MKPAVVVINGAWHRLLLAWICVLAWTHPLCAKVDCTAKVLSVVDREICTQPELGRLDREVDQLSRQMNAELKGAEAEILADSEMPFERTRNGCQNQDTSNAGYPERVRDCIRRVLTDRLNTLKDAQSVPASIRRAILQYTYLDVPFVRKYGAELVGRRVSVFGCIVLGHGGDAARRIHAVIEESPDRKGKPIVVLFKSMNERMAEFLDEKRPCAHWGGTLQRRDGELVLFAEDVLGQPLP
jgi:uncharacterized protein